MKNNTENSKEVKQTFDNLNLLETFQHGVFVFNSDLKLVSHNKIGAQMMGMPDRIMKPGTSIEDHFRFNAENGEYGDGDREELVSQRMQPLHDGKPFDYQIARPNGKVIWRHGMFNEDGWLVVTFTDVTVRAREEDFLRDQNSTLTKITESQEAEIQEVTGRLERQNHLLNTILSNISDGVSFVGRDLKLKMANNQIFELLDLPKEMNREGLSVRKIYEIK
jgi:PAS domain-containing protein